MKTTVLAALVAAFFLVGCGPNPAYNPDFQDTGGIFAKDDIDPPGGRSGLRLYTDHKTGCQYLGQLPGGLTPRMDGQGKHVGCE